MGAPFGQCADPLHRPRREEVLHVLTSTPTAARRGRGPALALCELSPSAIVGGQNASPGEYPSVAEITFGAFGCTGTLIAPTKVPHAPATARGRSPAPPVATPGLLARAADRRPHRRHTRRRRARPCRSSSVTVHPSYLLGKGYDISILKLSRNVDQDADQGRRRRRDRPVGRRHAGDDRRLGRDLRGRRRPEHVLPGGAGPDDHGRLLRRRLLRLRRADDAVRRLPAGRRRHLPGRLRRPDVRRRPRSSARPRSARAARSRASRASTPASGDTLLREWIRAQGTRRRRLTYGSITRSRPVTSSCLPTARSIDRAVVLWHGGSLLAEYGRDMMEPLARELAPSRRGRLQRDLPAAGLPAAASRRRSTTRWPRSMRWSPSSACASRRRASACRRARRWRCTRRRSGPAVARGRHRGRGRARAGRRDRRSALGRLAAVRRRAGRRARSATPRSTRWRRRSTSRSSSCTATRDDVVPIAAEPRLRRPRGRRAGGRAGRGPLRPARPRRAAPELFAFLGARARASARAGARRAWGGGG